MNSLQFNFDEDSLYSPISPDVIDISSDSDNAFPVAPGDVGQLEERFRLNPVGSNLMSAFLGSTLASLYTDATMTADQGGEMTTTGTELEKDLAELIADPPEAQMDSPGSFVASEFEEENLFPWTVGNSQNTSVNSFGRPIAAIPPNVRADREARGILPRPIPNYPPNHSPESAAFQQTQVREPMERNRQDNNMQPNGGNHNAVQGFNLSPMFFPVPLRGTAADTFLAPVQPLTQIGFPFSATHSTNLILIPAQERQSIRLLPTVMPNVAGYCDICGKCYDQIALETLGEYLVATEYENETVKERAIRSRAFIHGFEASLFLFRNAGLSHPARCDGSVVQQ